MAEPRETILQEKDILLFTGDTQAISGLIKKNPSISIPSVGMFIKRDRTDLVEIVITHNSSLINKTLKEENFRAKYDATAIAVYRNGERIAGKIGKMELKAGDAILLLAGADFKFLVNQTRDFYILSGIKEFHEIGRFKSILLIAGTILLIVLAALKIIGLFMGLVVFLSALTALGISSPKKIGKSVDLQLGLIIALALSLATAMIKTGVANDIAQLFILVSKPFGTIGLLAGIYIATSFLAAIITNKAAVAIVFPVSLMLAKELNQPYLPFVLVVSFAAAANFLTPVGYQTNTMVYGPGAYKFTDYFKIGAPLTIIYAIITTTILNTMCI